jgi:hypothetical protein
MNKLIQSIIISAVVLAPLSSLGLTATATSHHTSSHVSTVSLETTRTRRKVKKVKKIRRTNLKAKKPVIKASKKKTVTQDSEPGTMIPVTGGATPTPTTPATPAPQFKPIDPMMGNPVNKPGFDVTLPNPADGTPTIPVSPPGSIPNPFGDTSIPNPNLPTTLPAGSNK